MIFPSMLDIQSGTHIYQASTRPLSGVLVLLSFTVISLKSEEHIPIVSAPLILPWAILKPSAPPPLLLAQQPLAESGVGGAVCKPSGHSPPPLPPPNAHQLMVESGRGRGSTYLSLLSLGFPTSRCSLMLTVSGLGNLHSLLPYLNLTLLLSHCDFCLCFPNGF